MRAARALRAQWSAGDGAARPLTLADARPRDPRSSATRTWRRRGTYPARRARPRRADARRDVLVARPDARVPRPVLRRGGRPARRRHDLDAVPGDAPLSARRSPGSSASRGTGPARSTWTAPAPTARTAPRTRPATPPSSRARWAARCASSGRARTSTAGTRRARRSSSTSAQRSGRVATWSPGRRRRGCRSATPGPAEHPAARARRRGHQPAARARHPARSSRTSTRPTASGAVHAVVHWLEDSPFRTSPIRTPGKIANIFAVESFVDEVCALAKVDPVEYRLAPPRRPAGAGGAPPRGGADGLAAPALAAPARPRRGRAHRPGNRVRPLQARRDLRGDRAWRSPSSARPA